MKTEFKKDFYLGRNIDGEKIYLRAPSWDCGWYWGFGYLGNDDCHYHFDGLKLLKGRVVNLFDGMKNHFKHLSINDKKLWKFCELMETFYTLKQAAEVLGRGGSHYTSNPCESVIKNPEEVKRINEVVMPAIFNELNTILNS